jgi:VIT1/CCC1 family predicted Fe2+/Mn2+ transporter
MSSISFAAGGIVPLIPAFVLRGPALIVTTAVVSLVFLAMLGAGAARIGGAPIIAGALWVLVWGAFAMAITGVVGAAFGVIV